MVVYLLRPMLPEMLPSVAHVKSSRRNWVPFGVPAETPIRPEVIAPLAMKKVRHRREIFTVFRELFAKRGVLEGANA